MPTRCPYQAQLKVRHRDDDIAPSIRILFRARLIQLRCSPKIEREPKQIPAASTCHRRSRRPSTVSATHAPADISNQTRVRFTRHSSYWCWNNLRFRNGRLLPELCRLISEYARTPSTFYRGAQAVNILGQQTGPRTAREALKPARVRIDDHAPHSRNTGAHRLSILVLEDIAVPDEAGVFIAAIIDSRHFS